MYFLSDINFSKRDKQKNKSGKIVLVKGFTKQKNK